MNNVAWGFDCDHLHIYQKEKKNTDKFFLSSLFYSNKLRDVTDVNNSFIFAT
jgi:hypothetical protein